MLWSAFLKDDIELRFRNARWRLEKLPRGQVNRALQKPQATRGMQA
jgi:hypothetical protein